MCTCACACERVLVLSPMLSRLLPANFPNDLGTFCFHTPAVSQDPSALPSTFQVVTVFFLSLPASEEGGKTESAGFPDCALGLVTSLGLSFSMGVACLPQALWKVNTVKGRRSQRKVSQICWLPTRGRLRAAQLPSLCPPPPHRTPSILPSCGLTAGAHSPCSCPLDVVCHLLHRALQLYPPALTPLVAFCREIFPPILFPTNHRVLPSTPFTLRSPPSSAAPQLPT